MGSEWDHFVPGPEAWSEVYRVLKPGAHVLVFGGTRMYDMLVLALRLSGFEIRDVISWMYGSGFPKSHDISKAIDKMEGCWRGRAGNNVGESVVLSAPQYEQTDKGAPVTDGAKKWEGWGTALKPSWEPVVLVRKPCNGSVTKNVLEHGTGAIHIDGCRVGGPSPSIDMRKSCGHVVMTAMGWQDCGSVEDYKRYRPGEELGRWPANTVLEHSPDCVPVGYTEDGGYTIRRHDDGMKPFTVAEGDSSNSVSTTHAGGGMVPLYACVPDCPVRKLDDSVGSAGGIRGSSVGSKRVYDGGWSDPDKARVGYGYSGGPSRFFYCPKAQYNDREYGLAGKLPCHYCGNYETEDCAERRGKCIRNPHPTLKPISLLQYLIRLIAPPDSVGLDPFAGAGSVACASAQEGVRCISVEFDSEVGYCDIAKHRIRSWSRKKAD